MGDPTQDPEVNQVRPAGTEQQTAIRGALSGGYLGLLVTDTATAQALLKDRATRRVAPIRH